eukprot:403372434
MLQLEKHASLIGIHQSIIYNIYVRFLKGSLPKNPAPTIGVEFATKNVVLRQGGTVKAQIWDTAGQERYRAICSAHYRRALGALLVYDITKEQTFSSLSGWLDNLKTHAEQDIVIMLVGNKLDVVQQDPSLRQVPNEAAREFAAQEGLRFIETSAVTDNNVKDAFENLLQEIHNQRSKMPKATPKNPLILGEDTPGQKQSSGCC